MTTHEPVVEPFGTTLRRIRQTHGLSQRAFCRAIHRDTAYISKIETGATESLPSRAQIEAFATGIGCTPEERTELLAAAGRIEPELRNPVLRRLVVIALQLDASAIAGLVEWAHEHYPLDQ